MHFARILCATAIVLGSQTLGHACKGPTVIYDDNFRERDDGWFIQEAEFRSGKVQVGEGRMFITADAEAGNSILNLAFALPRDADICVNARIVKSTDLSQTGVGIVFWAKAYADNYLFQVTGGGMYWVTHFADRAWQSVTPPASLGSFKQGLGQDNLLRVMTKGQSVTLFVNDVQVARFRAPPPTGLVRAGFRASSFGKEPTAAEFRDFKVTNVP